ncbi:hypothetical protein R6Q57_020603 [Mikania cordata]
MPTPSRQYPPKSILGVEKTASQQEIKKAYHKLALRLHPDKNPGDEDAKEKFQHLQKVISILGDEEKHALYDQTGCVDDADLAGNVVQNLKDFFRTMLFCSMLCSDPKLDSHRFKDILDEAISAGELKSTKAYQKWGKQVSETKPPTNPLQHRGKSKKESDDLYAIISQRQSERKGRVDAMFSSLVSKYGGGEPSSEPTEEEFEAAREKLKKRKDFCFSICRIMYACMQIVVAVVLGLYPKTWRAFDRRTPPPAMVLLTWCFFFYSPWLYINYFTIDENLHLRQMCWDFGITQVVPEAQKNALAAGKEVNAMLVWTIACLSGSLCLEKSVPQQPGSILNSKKDRCYSEKDAAIIVRQMLKFAAECHLHGLVHRDMKPEA